MINLGTESSYQPNNDGEELFRKAAEGFNEQRYSWGFVGRNFDELYIEELSIKLENANNLMQFEIRKINAFRTEYLNNWATDHNKSIEKKCNLAKITKDTGKIFVKIQKAAKKRRNNKYHQERSIDENQSITANSPITSAEYQTSTDSIDQLPEYHKRLYEAIQKSLNTISSLIDTCMDVMKMVEQITNDPEWAKMIYEDQVKKIRELLKSLGLDLDILAAQYNEGKDIIYDAWQKADNKDEFFAKNYHVFTVANMRMYVTGMMLREARKANKYAQLLECLPKDKRTFAKVVFENMSDFTDFIPQGKNNTKLLARFFNWAKPSKISQFYYEFHQAYPTINIVKYNTLTSWMKKEKKEHEAISLEYNNSLERKIEEITNRNDSNNGRVTPPISPIASIISE